MHHDFENHENHVKLTVIELRLEVAQMRHHTKFDEASPISTKDIEQKPKKWMDV